jgi:hypothetical protein
LPLLKISQQQATHTPCCYRALLPVAAGAVVGAEADLACGVEGGAAGLAGLVGCTNVSNKVSRKVLEFTMAVVAMTNLRSTCSAGSMNDLEQ